ncbi:dermonecrotic toxin domain-containing protein [Pseudomonas sp. LB3P14]
MTDRLFADLPSPVPIVLPTSSPLPKTYDESLLHSASARWRESSEGLRELFAGVPSIRASLERLLKRQLDLDGHGVGLMFYATDEHSERFILLTDVFAFVFQHPELENTLDQRCRVIGLAASHALFALTPLQLLARLKALDVEELISERWNAYWEARAPGTPVSRRERANRLYRNHFEATAQRAFAERTLNADQLKPLSLLMDATATVMRLDNKSINCEQLNVLLSDNSKVRFPAAWVISVGDTAPVEQLLYLPCRSMALKAFATRSDMQTWLTEQALVPIGLPSADMVFQYTRRALPLSAGMSELLDLQQMAQLAALRNGSAQKPGLAEQGSRAMVDVDTIDRQRSDSPVFAAPPSLKPAQAGTAAGDSDEQSLFGSLYADIPWPLRQAASHAQRDRLEALQKEAGDNDDLKPLKDLQKALEAAEDAADKTASAMLYRERSLDAVTWNREFTALQHAHKDGLHAEGGIQLALKQLSDEESSLLKALLDTPDDPGADRVAASLTLSLTEQDGEQPKVNTQELTGAFLMTHADALLDVSSPHSVLLYWPGIGGGLQRFANRRALERQLFKIGDNDNNLVLQLKKISGDPLHYALNQVHIDFEGQAAGIRQRNAGTDQQTQRAEQLEALHQRTLATLQVPVHAARSLAFAHGLEQTRSAALAILRPDWLAKLSRTEREGLKSLIQAYIGAMHRSHDLMTVILEPRDDFTRRHLQARLRKDFNIKGHFDVQLELPDSVTWEKQYSATPTGKVETSVMVASAKRSKMSLADLAQLNIDKVHSVQQDAFKQRLIFMRLEVTAAVAQERITLLNGINLTYLRKILPELDLPKAYEQKIQRAFMGSADDLAFVSEHRRECLIEPWRLMLKLQGEFARLQKHISHDDLHILNIAIDANTPQAWLAGGKRVAILPAYLSVGGKDTPNEGGVTLSGVTFIQEQVSGVTLLYTPDSPDDRFLRRYDSLEAARRALFNLCAQDSMIDYLAGRALQGNVRAHVSRINEAQLKHFDALIGVGTRWPTSTSLAAHLLDAHRGRLIEAHRGTSRSNDALYLERYALQGPRAFAYIKMALGLLPFIGTAVALYDAWTAANQAAAAFLRGDVGDGIAELGSVLLSLIDAAMDLLPGEAIVSALGSGARTLTRTRQLRALSLSAAALHAPSTRQARHVVARFAGYEYEKTLSLTGLQPATHGVYRNVYRHADGDFIVRQGRVFQVEWSNDSRNWRLTGNSRKTYKQPLALDEAGKWDTWFGVYGTTFEGGGLGGGGVLGHMADALDPMWPASIRERLPRWWVDRAHRRHHALTEAADDIALQIDTRVKQTDATLAAYNAAPPDRPANLLQAADSACIADIELANRHFQTLSDLLPLTHGNKRRVLLDFQSNGALLMADRYKQRLYIANHQVEPLMNRIDALTVNLDAIPPTALPERLRVLEDIRKLRLEMLTAFDTIESLLRDLNHWYQRISVRLQKAQLTPEVTLLNGRLSEANILYLRTGNLLETVTRYDTTNDVSWFILQGQTRVKRTEVDRALFTQYSLLEVTATRTQRNQILQDCIEQYDQFRRAMNAWTASYPQHFHLDAVPPLLEGIEKMGERARKALDITPPAAPRGTISKKVFTTENDQLLIGVERWEPATQQRQYTLTGQDGYKEIWEPATNGRFRLQNPQQQPVASARRNLESLVTEARQKLEMQDAYQTKVQSYATQGMLPVDLEDMMLKEANELTHRARGIEALSPQDALIAQLRDKATELIATGRALRTRQSLLTKKPTDGMLDDLVTQGVVEIRKTSPIKNLGKRRDGRIDYMQEYEVWDLTKTPPEVLWYAHFHYSRATPGFSEFEKAHLKLPEHQFLTHADNADLPYADIGKRSAVLPHFENL